MSRLAPLCLGVALAAATAQPALAALTVLDSFNPADLGQLIGVGFSPTTDRVFVYGGGATVEVFDRSGVNVGPDIASSPGENANDADVTFAPGAITLGSTSVAAGSMLFVNGETGVADIYAVDPSTGTVITSLATSFGASHVVGGGYHPGRNSFFLVQDNVPAAGIDNRIAEIDVSTGAILNAFDVDAALATFSVSFGDLEVGGNGNLFVVSSLETSILELTPLGAFVQTHALPTGVSSLSGIGFDNARGEAWVSGTGGTVWRLGGLPVTPPVGVPAPSVLALALLGVFGFGAAAGRKRAR